jgi:hypothetical protein
MYLLAQLCVLIDAGYSLLKACLGLFLLLFCKKNKATAATP